MVIIKGGIERVIINVINDGEVCGIVGCLFLFLEIDMKKYILKCEWFFFFIVEGKKIFLFCYFCKI